MATMAPSDDLISKAAIILKEIYNKRDENKKLDDTERKDGVLKSFGSVFSLDNIDSLQYEKVKEFAALLINSSEGAIVTIL